MFLYGTNFLYYTTNFPPVTLFAELTVRLRRHPIHFLLADEYYSNTRTVYLELYQQRFRK